MPILGDIVVYKTCELRTIRLVLVSTKISPYDITYLDNPGLSITQVQLKGDNYDEWAYSFRTTLRAQKKFGFIDGTIARPGEKLKDLED